MSVYLILYILFVTSIAVAAAASLLSDVFFFVSLRHRKINKHESKNLQILCGTSAICTIISIALLASIMSIRVSEGIIYGQGILVGTMIILIVAFVCSVFMRNTHLPTLHRHQHDYHHLSDSFKEHQTSILSTTAVSIVSWLFIIVIIGLDSRGLIGTTDFWKVIILYAVLAFLFSKFAVFTKKKVS